MSIKIRCKVCQAGLKLPDAAMGKAVKCPKCANRIKVPSRPSGAPRSRSVSGRPKQRQPGGSTDFLSALESLPHEDQNTMVCPRCGNEVDPEIGECDDCGIDVETGLPTESRRRQMAIKGEDPQKYYQHIVQDFFVFPFKNTGLIGRAILVSMLAYLIFAISRFFIFFSDGKTVELFMWLFISIAGSLLVGWIWTISSELVKYTFHAQAARKKKKKPKPFSPKPFDIFLVFQNGYKFFAWILCNVVVHSLVLFPVILVIAIVCISSRGEEALVPFLYAMQILLGFSFFLIVLSIPLAIGHLSMPVVWPGWNPFKLAYLVVVRAPVATLTWALLTVLFTAIPIAAYSAGCIFLFDEEFANQVWIPMEKNAEIVAVQRKYFAPGVEKTDRERELLRAKANNDVDFMLLLKTEGILLVIASFSSVFLIGSARNVGHLVFYNQDVIDLIQDAPGTQYRVMDKKKYLPIPFRSNVGMIWLFVDLGYGFVVAMSFLYALTTGAYSAGEVFMALANLYLLFVLPYLIYNDGLCRVFEKTGKNGLASLLPVLRGIFFFNIVGFSALHYLIYLIINLSIGAMVVLLGPAIPIVGLLMGGTWFIGNMVVWIYLNLKLADRFEKPISYGLGLAFLPSVFYFILGRSMDRAKRLPTDPPPELDDDDFA